MILDVGSQSVERIQAAINDAATLVWNGPLGVFEIAPFDQGTVAAARHAWRNARGPASSSRWRGGGDTVAALNHAGVADDFSYVSTAGGAFLEWMEGKPLPGVEALRAGAPAPPGEQDGTMIDPTMLMALRRRRIRLCAGAIPAGIRARLALQDR